VAREGWYTDPFARHEARWFSDGSPTSLVRDGGATSTDPSPDIPFQRDPLLIEPTPSVNGDDLVRADDGPDNPDAGVDAAWTYFTRSSGSN
jgi:hypothetical protein